MRVATTLKTVGGCFGNPLSSRILLTLGVWELACETAWFLPNPQKKVGRFLPNFFQPDKIRVG